MRRKLVILLILILCFQAVLGATDNVTIMKIESATRIFAKADPDKYYLLTPANDSYGWVQEEKSYPVEYLNDGQLSLTDDNGKKITYLYSLRTVDNTAAQKTNPVQNDWFTWLLILLLVLAAISALAHGGSNASGSAAGSVY